MSQPRLTGLVVSIALSGSLLLSGCSSLFHKDGDRKKDTGPTKTEQGYYEAAQRYLANGSFNDAATNLEALETYYPVGAYTEQGQLDLMYAHFHTGDYAATITAADRFIRLYPQNPQIDYVYYLRGVANVETGGDSLLRYTNLNSAHRDTGYLRSAYDDFRNLVTKYPQSVYAPDAAQRMRYIANQFSEGEMNVARYNVQRKAYVGAIQRARWVLEYYQETPQIPEAVATLIYCYQQLGMNDLANQYLDIMKANYPQYVHGNKVNIAETRGEASLLNKMTLGILGRPAAVINAQPSTSYKAHKDTEQSSEGSTFGEIGHSLKKAGVGVSHWINHLFGIGNNTVPSDSTVPTETAPPPAPTTPVTAPPPLPPANSQSAS